MGVCTMKPRVRVYSWNDASWYVFQGKVFRNYSDCRWLTWEDHKTDQVPFVLF